MFKLGGRPFDGQFQCVGFMSNGYRLMAFWPRFKLAAHVVWTGFIAVLVPQVDFDPCQVFFVSFERALNGSTYPLLQSDAALNMVIAVDLDLPSSSLISASSREVRGGLEKPGYRDLLITELGRSGNISTPKKR